MNVYKIYATGGDGITYLFATEYTEAAAFFAADIVRAGGERARIVAIRI